MTRESDIEKYLVKSVINIGGEIRKVVWQGRRNAPDRLVMYPWWYPGHPDQPSVWVELKRPGEEPTDAQLREHERMRKCGLIVFIVNSFKAVDELVEYGQRLKELFYATR